MNDSTTWGLGDEAPLPLALLRFTLDVLLVPLLGMFD